MIAQVGTDYTPTDIAFFRQIVGTLLFRAWLFLPLRLYRLIK
jgi:hypothetical protein